MIHCVINELSLIFPANSLRTTPRSKAGQRRKRKRGRVVASESEGSFWTKAFNECSSLRMSSIRRGGSRRDLPRTIEHLSTSSTEKYPRSLLNWRETGIRLPGVRLSSEGTPPCRKSQCSRAIHEDLWCRRRTSCVSCAGFCHLGASAVTDRRLRMSNERRVHGWISLYSVRETTRTFVTS